MRTLCVIVNYRTGDLAVDCLRSLAPEVADAREAFGPVEVVIADNASGDGSLEQVGRAISDNGWGAWARTMPLPRNGGFAHGNNEAIRPALASAQPPDLVWLLNPDTLVRPGGLGGLLTFMRDHGEVGLAGSRLEDPDGTPQRSAFRFPGVASELNGGLKLGLASWALSRYTTAPPVPDSAGPTDWVAGASLIVRREVFDAIGLMDEGYFMYYEEVDFCQRAARAGWPCWYVPQSRVVHLVGQASGVTARDGRNRRRPAYWFQSRRRYFLKHLGPARAAAADAAFMAAFATWRLRRRLQRKADPDPERLLADFARHSVFARGFGV